MSCCLLDETISAPIWQQSPNAFSMGYITLSHLICRSQEQRKFIYSVVYNRVRDELSQKNI